MKTLASTAVAVLAMGSASLAAWQPARGSDEVKLDMIAALQGRCTAMIVAGKPAPCAQRGGVLVTRLKNQRTLVMIGMADGKSALTFVGEGAHSDAAPLADLPISRVYVGSDPNAPHVDAKGSCKLEPGSAGKLACQAVDAAGVRYSLEFQGSAAPEIQRF